MGELVNSSCRSRVAIHQFTDSPNSPTPNSPTLCVRYNIAQFMPVVEFLTSSGFGSLLGMRHALEPDHLAAVSTLVTRERSGVKAALLGICWGLGHTAGLIVVGVVLVVLRAELPTRIADVFEMLVAIMLV